MGYPGSKSGAGVFQRIISLMPAHSTFVEAFMGSGQLLRRKRPAGARNVGIDVDGRTVGEFGPSVRIAVPGVEILVADAIDWLSSNAAMMDPDWVVYADPPYLGETRTRRLYRCELWTVEEHRRLLSVLVRLPARVLVSGYWSSLYAAMLPGWRGVSFDAMTRGGLRREFVWCNFADGLSLHDVRFVGDGFRERERIRRKRDRWVSRFSAMTAAERQVIREALDGVDRTPSDATLLEERS